MTRRFLLRARSKGFTLVELLITLLIGTIGLVAVFSFFVMQSRMAQSQEKTAEVQQNVRIAMEMITRDLRSAGFGLDDPSNAIRIEQQCGKNPLTPAGMKDGCPNGSDRVMIHFRKVNNRLSNCQESECSGQSNNKLMLRQANAICPGFPGACGTSLDPVLSCGLTNTCGSAPKITYCQPNGFPCTLAEVKKVTCNNDCGNPGPNGGCVELELCANLPSAFQDVRGSAGIDVIRIYQLLDVDPDGAGPLLPDGSTELVTSDQVVGSVGGSITYFTVIENVDDFQLEVNGASDPDFRTSDCSSVACWVSRDVYRGYEDNDNDNDTDDSDYPYPNRTWRTYSNTGIRAGCQNLTANEAASANWGCSARLRGVRFSVAARTAQREIDGSRALNIGFHPNLGDNIQAQQTFVAGTTPTAGAALCYGTETCGCGGATYPSYLTCSGAGNAQGYRWRVMSNEVLLRNIRGLVAN